MTSGRRRMAESRLRMGALLLFVNLAVLAVAGMGLYTSYIQYQDRAATTSRNTNRLVSQSITGDLDLIDLALRGIADEVRRLRGTGLPTYSDDLAEFLHRMRPRLPMTDFILVADAEGRLVVGSGALPTGIAVADRGYFKRLKENIQSELEISEPVQGRVSGKWVLIFARRIALLDGSFGGIVLAPVPIEWFERKFNALEVGANGTVVMRGDVSRNFDLLARFPHAGYVGQTKVSQTFRDTITASPAGGTYEAVAGADGIKRTFSYQPIGNYPLITLVGMATEDYMAEWRRESTKVMVLTAAFILATSLAGLLVARAWRDLERRSEELARSNADLEQFAFVASHDLQTPLRNIASYAQLLQRRYQGRLDSDADDFIGYIVGGAKHMATMIPDLLNYARVSTAPPELVPVDLSQAIRVVLHNLGPAITAAQAEIKVEGLPTVMGEPNQITSLLQNLVENALTYRHEGRQAQVVISAASQRDGYWKVSVQDNGIGIEPAYFDKIFVIFQRLDPIRFPHGTGIGLALCRRIVERFGGEIWVESEYGTGTVFSFVLKGADATLLQDAPALPLRRVRPPA